MNKATVSTILGFNIPKTIIYDFMVFFYLSALIILSIANGFSLLTYLAFIIFAALFFMVKPQTGFSLIILLTMIFERFFTLQPLIIDQQQYKLYPLDIVIIFTAIGCLIQFFRNKKSQPAIKGKRFDWPEVLFFYFSFLMLTFFIKSFFDINASLDLSFSALKNYSLYGILYFIAFYLSNTKEKFKKNVHVFLLGGLAIIFFITYGLMTGQGLWTEFTPLSTAGVRYLAGTHAFYLVLASTIAVAFIAGKKFNNNYLPTIVLAIWSIGILGSLMRHLWLALIVGFIVILAAMTLKEKKRLLPYLNKISFTAASVFIILFLGANLFPNNALAAKIQPSVDYLKDRASSLTQLNQDSSANWRLDFWRSAADSWKKTPIVGIGLGHQILFESNGWQTLEEIRNIHNSLLAILIQTGVLGIIIFLTFIGSVISSTWKKLKDNDLRPYLAGLMACLFIFLFCSLFQPYLETNLTGIFLWIILGLMRAGTKLAEV